jgi:hypothetical protein
VSYLPPDSKIERAWERWARAVAEEKAAKQAWEDSWRAMDNALEQVRQLRDEADKEYVPPMVDAATVAPRITSKLP